MTLKTSENCGNSDKRNLYEELYGILENAGKTVDDISWVECTDQPSDERLSIPIGNFIEVAKSTWYDPYSYGFPELPNSLKIYGKDRSFLIDVYEYDGRQNLEYIDMEKKRPDSEREIDSLIVEDGDYYYNPVWSDH